MNEEIDCHIEWVARFDGELTRAISGSYDNDSAASILDSINIVDKVFKKLGIPQPEVK